MTRDATAPARHLTVVRHAKSSWKDRGLADDERPLNRRGERDAPEMARRVAAWDDRPTLVVTSVARRAAETAEAFADASSPRPELVRERGLYLASAKRVLERVAALDPRHRHVMLVGHNPGLTEFVNRFGDAGLDNLPTCGVVRMKVWVPEWSDVGWQCASVEVIDTPKDPAR